MRLTKPQVAALRYYHEMRRAEREARQRLGSPTIHDNTNMALWRRGLTRSVYRTDVTPKGRKVLEAEDPHGELPLQGDYDGPLP